MEHGKRYILVDYMHLVHRFMHTAMDNPLMATVNLNGQYQRVDTSLPSMLIKAVFRYSNYGSYPLAICLEGGNAYRKEYFKRVFGDEADEYKAGRKQQTGGFYESSNLTVSLLHQGGVSLYRVENYEADDCIASLVHQIKKVDQETPIDIITGDSDLLPLVDEQVSVYMRGKRDFSEDGCPLLRGYFQITPRTWDDYFAYSSTYKNFFIPYNTAILFKLIRGDNSDKIKGAIKGYGAVKYTELMNEMSDNLEDFVNGFRYDNDFQKIGDVMGMYFNEETVNKMELIYHGIKPRMVELLLPQQPDYGRLQQVLAPLRINLPYKY